MEIMNVKKGLMNVKEFERGVRFRFGRGAGIVEPGLHLAVPGISEIRVVDLRPRHYKDSLETISSDNFPVVLPMGMIYRANDVEKVVVKAPTNFEQQISTLVESKLGVESYKNKTFEEIFLNRENMGNDAESFLSHYLNDWGFEIDTVRIGQPEIPEQVMDLRKTLYETEMRNKIEPLKAEIQKKLEVIKAKASAEAYKTEVEPRIEAMEKYYDVITKAAGEIAEKYKTDARDVMYILFGKELGKDHPVTKKIFTKMSMEGLGEGAKAAAAEIGSSAEMPYLMESLKGIGGLYLMNMGNIGDLAKLDQKINSSNFPGKGKY